MGVGVLFQGGECADGVVHAQVGFSLVGIRAVTGEAFVGQDRTDVEVIADGIGEIVGCPKALRVFFPEGGDE